MQSVGRPRSVAEIAFDICQTLQRLGAFARVAALARACPLHLIPGLSSDTLWAVPNEKHLARSAQVKQEG